MDQIAYELVDDHGFPLGTFTDRREAEAALVQLVRDEPTLTYDVAILVFDGDRRVGGPITADADGNLTQHASGATRPSPPDKAPGGLLTADDVARMLGVGKSWVYAETRAGRIPHVRLGRYVRYRRESLGAWIAGQERGPRK